MKRSVFVYPKFLKRIFYSFFITSFVVLTILIAVGSIKKHSFYSYWGSQIHGDYVITLKDQIPDSLNSMFTGSFEHNQFEIDSESYTIGNYDSLISRINEIDGVKIAIGRISPIRRPSKTVITSKKRRMLDDSDKLVGYKTEDIIKFHEDGNIYDFYDIRSNKGILISDAFAEKFSISKDLKEISIRMSNANLNLEYRFVNTVTVPIAGFFSINGNNETSAGGVETPNTNNSICFIDLDYYDDLYYAMDKKTNFEGEEIIIDNLLPNLWFNSHYINYEKRMTNIKPNAILVRVDKNHKNVEIELQKIIRDEKQDLYLVTGEDHFLEPMAFEAMKEISDAASPFRYLVLILTSLLASTIVLKLLELNENEIGILLTLGKQRKKLISEIVKKWLIPPTLTSFIISVFISIFIYILPFGIFTIHTYPYVMLVQILFCIISILFVLVAVITVWLNRYHKRNFV